MSDSTMSRDTSDHVISRVDKTDRWTTRASVLVLTLAEINLNNSVFRTRQQTALAADDKLPRSNLTSAEHSEHSLSCEKFPIYAPRFLQAPKTQKFPIRYCYG